MKLAEALILRSDSQKRVEQIKKRLFTNAKVQEGDEPAEVPQDLLIELNGALANLENLIQQINRTNTLTVVEEGVSLSDALAVRDVLKLRVGIYRGLIDAATISQSRYSRSEIKFRSTVNIADIQKQVDQLSKEYRELDAKIQALNWTTELIE